MLAGSLGGHFGLPLQRSSKIPCRFLWRNGKPVAVRMDMAVSFVIMTKNARGIVVTEHRIYLHFMTHIFMGTASVFLIVSF